MYKHELGAEVRLKLSQETGEVQGRAEYTNSENAYFVLYQAADGRQVTAWWGESQIHEPPVDIITNLDEEIPF